MLNPRQEAFVNAYARGGFKNATKAAIEAGYKERSARALAARLLTKDDIVAAIEALRKPAQKEAAVDAAYVLAKLKRIIEFGCQEVPYVTKEKDPDGFTVSTEVPGVFSLVDAREANSALKTLANCLGMGKEQADKDQTIQTLSDTLHRVMQHGR